MFKVTTVLYPIGHSENWYIGSVFGCFCMFTYFTNVLFTGLIPVIGQQILLIQIVLLHIRQNKGYSINNKLLHDFEAIQSCTAHIQPQENS